MAPPAFQDPSAARIRLQIGDQVRISRGALAGLIGRVTGFTTSNRCRLASDDLPASVTILIAKDAVDPLDAAWPNP